MVQHRCHTVTFFRQHEFSLKYSPLITSFYQNHYQNDNQIVHRCYMQTLLPIHDLCTFKKWHLLMTFISQNHSRHHPKHFTIYKFTINWRLQSKWQSMWQSKWLSLSLHLQMNNEYLNILHNIIFYQDVTVWHLLTVFGVTVWHLHKLWHGNGTF